MRRKPAAQLDPRILVGTGLALFAWFCAFSINKPLTTDEAEIDSSALAIAKTGKPIYYMGDTPEQYIPRKDLWQIHEAPKPGYTYGLWHPPLYIYLLALSHKLFGTASWTARLPGVLCFLATLWLLRGIINRLLPPEKSNAVFGVTSFLYLTNPLLIQQSMMLDVDNTVVTLTSVLFFHEFLRLEVKGTGWAQRSIWLSLLIGLTMWAKEFAGLFLGLSLLVCAMLRRQWRDALAAVGIVVVGSVLFWVSWWVYCKLTEMPVMYFVRFTILGKLAIGEGLLTTIAKQAGWGSAWFSVVHSLINIIVWTSPFYAALFLMVVGWRVRVFIANKRPEPLDLLLLYVLVMIAATQVYRPSGWFLKYGYPGHSILVVLLSAYLHEKLGQWSRREWAVAGVLSVIVAIAQVGWGDPVLWFYTGLLKGLSDHNVWLVYGAAAIVLFVVMKLSRGKWPTSTAVAATLAIGLVGANLGLNWQQRAPFATSISWNNYGEAGFAEAAEYLKSVLKPADVPVCRKDFGYYLNKGTDTMDRRWINPVVLVDVKTADELVRNITAPGVNYIVLDRYSIRRDTVPIIQQHYAEGKQFGSFYILKRVRG